MDKRYQIFVSSTYSDLKEERENVINELTRVGYIAVGMEQFPATDEEQLEYIRLIIDEFDYYVVIIRGKYGSLANDGISFTEKECDYALETKKPVLAFLIKNPGKLTVDETDNDPEKAKKLNAFKTKLEERRIVKYWEDGSQLVNDIKDLIHDIVRRRPGIGWIRGDQALDPTVYKELETERRQNKELREKLGTIGKEDIVFPSHLMHGSDLFEIEFGDKSTKTRRNFKISWKELFIELEYLIFSGDFESTMGYRLRETIANKIDIAERNIELSDLYIKQARYQLEALELIKAIQKKDLYGSTQIAWTLTDKGRRYISHLKALRRPAAS